MTRLTCLFALSLVLACSSTAPTAPAAVDATTDAPDAMPDIHADVAADVPVDIAFDVSAACCPIGAPSCDCTAMGGSPSQPGGCKTECDTAPVGWTQALDTNGCPYWQNIGQMCLVMPTHCDLSPATFPLFTPFCNVDADCAVVIHQIDCCGSKVAWGINAMVEAMFTGEEATCRDQYPKCKCAQKQTVADDGKTAPGDVFAAKCLVGQCKSYAP